MPLLDRPEFRAWLARREEGRVGRRHGEPTSCTACGGPLDRELVEGDECLVCLAERFGTETAESWLAEVVAGFVRAAVADPFVLARMLAELVAHGRDIAELHAPPAKPA